MACCEADCAGGETTQDNTQSTYSQVWLAGRSPVSGPDLDMHYFILLIDK